MGNKHRLQLLEEARIMTDGFVLHDAGNRPKEKSLYIISSMTPYQSYQSRIMIDELVLEPILIPSMVLAMHRLQVVGSIPGICNSYLVTL